jgi:hypothetical protein
MILTLKDDTVKRPDHETVDFELHLKVQAALREEYDKDEVGAGTGDQRPSGGEG